MWRVAEGARPVEACEAFDKEIGDVSHVCREIDEGSARVAVDHYLACEGAFRPTMVAAEAMRSSSTRSPPARRASRGATSPATTIRVLMGLPCPPGPSPSVPRQLTRDTGKKET